MHPSLPQRKSPRLQGYDYTQRGAYFVKICTYARTHLFGEVIDGEMILNRAGEIATRSWIDLSNHHPGIELDEFVVMPNHVHAIIVVEIMQTSSALLRPAGCVKTDKAGLVPAQGLHRGSLGAVVGSYKAAVTRRIREITTPKLVVWQPRYHDHIIRGERDLNRIREYIRDNPARWTEDVFYGVPYTS